MSASVNKVILIGNLGADPKTRSMPDGSLVASLSLATTDTWTDRQGQRQEDTQWHRIRLSGRLAKTAAEFLKKGDPVYIEGSLGYRKWSDAQGVERHVSEIFATEMRMLGSARGKSRDAQSAPASAPAPAAELAAPAPAPAFAGGDVEDDIPF